MGKGRKGCRGEWISSRLILDRRGKKVRESDGDVVEAACCGYRITHPNAPFQAGRDSTSTHAPIYKEIGFDGAIREVLNEPWIELS